MAWIITYGTLDDNVNNYFQLSKISSQRKLSLTCGRTVQFALDMLNELGIESRQISLFALNNINNMSDGHVMIEVYRKDLNKWVLYDLSNN